MTYEELKSKVRELETALSRTNKELSGVRDELVKQRRLYEDSINNLDEDNFAANYRVQQGNRFSEIKQTVDGIKTTVGDLSDDVDNAVGDISTVQQTAKDITAIVMKMFAQATATTINPLGDNADNLDKNVVYEYDKKIYCYDDIQEKWIQIYDDSVSSSFKQTAYGFKLNGNVVIDGNTFVNGDFSTAVEGSVNVRVSAGRIVYYVNNGNEAFELLKLERTDAGFMQMYLYDGWKLMFDGNFDFSPATVSGLYAVFE